MGLIPWTPPVQLAFWSWMLIGPMLSDHVTLERFLKKSGTISPKPRVTMAR